MSNQSKKEELISLAKRAKDKDEEAFWHLYELKWKDLLYSAVKIMGNEHDGADAAQEAFMSAYKNIGKLVHPEGINSWLYRILTNTCYTMLNKTIAHREELNIDDYTDSINEENADFLPEEHLDREESKSLLLKEVNTLAQDQRMAILMFYYMQMSLEEIADATNSSVSTIGVRLHRARHTIKKRLALAESKGNFYSAAASMSLLTAALRDEADRIITPDMYNHLKSHIISGIGLISGVTAASTITTVSTATSAVSTSSAGAATGATGTALGTKILIGATIAATLGTAAYVGKDYFFSANQIPVYSSTMSQIPSISEQTMVLEGTEDSSILVTLAPSEKPIETVADMIGDQDALWLSDYFTNPTLDKRGDLHQLLERNNMKFSGQQVLDNDSYDFYVLEKQDKRLLLIEWNNDQIPDTGISYLLTDQKNPLPNGYELMFLYNDWKG